MSAANVTRLTGLLLLGLEQLPPLRVTGLEVNLAADDDSVCLVTVGSYRVKDGAQVSVQRDIGVPFLLKDATGTVGLKLGAELLVQVLS